MENTSTITQALVRSVSDIEGLSSLLSVPVKKLVEIANQAPRLYEEISIQKKDGSPRVINAPSRRLKTVQRSILDNILIWEPITECAYGFSRGKSVVDNARMHSTSSYVLNADLKDFFPSVHFTRICKMLTALGATEFVARTLTGLTTLNHCLPQGAPTSPYLATLALRNLDIRIMKLCVANRLRYTRYFDDITISGGKRAHQVLDTLRKIANTEGYEVHSDPSKLKLYGPRDEKLITGILVRGGELSVPNVAEISDYIKRLQREGIFALKEDDPFKEKMSLQGKIVFVSQVNMELGTRLKTEFEAISW